MIEIDDLANLYNVESGDINVNGDHLIQVLYIQHENEYSGYSEAFSHSHRFVSKIFFLREVMFK